MSKTKSSPRLRFTGAAILLSALLFLVPALKDGNDTLYLLALLVPCGMLLAGTVLARVFSLDRLILNVSLWICAVGIAAFAFTDPQAALAHALNCGAGMVVLLVGGILIRSMTDSLLTSVCTAFLGILLLAGKALSPALSIPVTGAALALLLIAFTSLLSRQGPISAAFTGLAALALLLFIGETQEALLWGITLTLLLFAADGRLIIVLPSLAAVLLVFFGAYRLFPGMSVAPSASSLNTLVSAGAIGADTLPEGIAAAENIPLFHRLTGHFGLLFAGLTALLFLPLTLRGTSVAVTARTRFHSSLAMGICLLLALRTFFGLLCAFEVIPFSGPDLPLLTSSLPDLWSQLFLIGMLCGISGRNDADLADDAHLAMLAR
ncbi:MAG: hypothetical protein J5841_02720 [Clostridia bacterium]|nr:hypothetical protein [Clostridia bacterium]